MIKQYLTHQSLIRQKTHKEKYPREEIRIRDPLVYTLNNPIKTVSHYI